MVDGIDHRAQTLHTTPSLCARRGSHTANLWLSLLPLCPLKGWHDSGKGGRRDERWQGGAGPPCRGLGCGSSAHGLLLGLQDPLCSKSLIWTLTPRN